MVEKASAGNVAAAIRPPDFRKAVISIRGLDAKKDKIASINGEIADIWAKIEGLKVNKIAGKLFAKLDQLEPADRLDVIRSFNGLADASGWEKGYEDLVDSAEGKVVDMRLGGDPAKTDADAGADGDGAGDKAVGEAPGPLSKSIGKARKHLGTDKPAAGKQAPDAMTG
jgi:hypothetical protein